MRGSSATFRRAAAVVLACSAAAPAVPAEPARPDGAIEGFAWHPDVRPEIWTDPDSGCRYVLFRNDVGGSTGLLALAPKLRADGRPDCPGVGP